MKFVVIGLGVMFAIGIIFKMLESEKGAKFVSRASVLAVALGVVLINDGGYNTRIDACGVLSSYPPSWADCMVNAAEEHDTNVNKGWGYAICGTIAGLFGLAALGEKSGPAKTHSAVQNSKPLRKK